MDDVSYVYLNKHFAGLSPRYLQTEKECEENLQQNAVAFVRRIFRDINEMNRDS